MLFQFLLFPISMHNSINFDVNVNFLELRVQWGHSGANKVSSMKLYALISSENRTVYWQEYCFCKSESFFQTRQLKSVKKVEIVSAFYIMQNYLLSLKHLKYGRNAALTRYIVFIWLPRHQVAILETLNKCHINGESVSAERNGALQRNARVISNSASVSYINNRICISL